MSTQITTVDQFFDACKGKSIDYKLKAAQNLEDALKDNNGGKWNDQHCKAIRELITRIRISTVIEF